MAAMAKRRPPSARPAAAAPTPAAKSAAELFGRPEPRDTGERILFTAMDLFYAHGFHEVGLDRILEATGVTKSTFYNHFESRDALILAALELRDTWEQAAMERDMRAIAGYDPRALLQAAFQVMDRWFNHADYKGCMFVAASAEFPTPWHPIHKRAAQSFVVSEATAKGLARAAGVRDPDGLAAEWLLLLQGALTQRLVNGRNDAARRAGEIFARRLAEATGPGPGASGA
jgi:AcrR family transcriptional regulator